MNSRPQHPSITDPQGSPLYMALHHVAEAQIRAALMSAGGNVTEAASALGIHRSALHRWIATLGIKLERDTDDR